MNLSKVLSNLMNLRFAALSILVPAQLLFGCSTTVLDYGKLAEVNPDEWASLKPLLPIELHGASSTSAETQLGLMTAFPQRSANGIASLDVSFVPSSGKRIVIYINPGALPSQGRLCGSQDMTRETPQTGRLAAVTSALCNGSDVISYATGKVLLAGSSDVQIKQSLDVVVSELFDVLQPGAEDPSRYYN